MVVYLHILLGMRIANVLRSWGIVCFCYGHRPCIAFYFILKISTMDTLALQKILVPIDFSDTSLNALQTAVAMAKRHQAKLVLVHIVSVNTAFVMPEGSVILDSGLDQVLKTANQQLAQWVETLVTTHGIDAQGLVETGSVTDSIVHMAKSHQVDLIVLGSHGASGLREFFMGSTAYSVIRGASCPVLTIPPHQQWLDFKKILFPVRPIADALEKYDFARRIIRKNNAKLIVMGVLERLGNHTFEALNDEAAKLIKVIEEDGVSVETQFHFSDTLAETILEKANELEVDLLVVTASLDYQIKELFIGPFDQQIVNHAKVPVLSIRPHPSPQEGAQTKHEPNIFPNPYLTIPF